MNTLIARLIGCVLCFWMMQSAAWAEAPVSAPAETAATAEASNQPDAISPTATLHLKSDPVRSGGTSMGEATGQMIIGLVAVLGLIFVLAWVAKRFNLAPGGATAHMKVVSSLSVGPKEKLLLVEVENQRLLLGVTTTQVSLIREMGDVPEAEPQSDFSSRMQAILKSGSVHEK